MPKKRSPLTTRQIGELRSKQLKSATNLLTRFAKYAEGTLTDPDGNAVEVSANQLKAGLAIINHVLPTQSAQTIDTHITESNPKALQADIEALKAEFLKTLTPEDIASLQFKPKADSVDPRYAPKETIQ